MRDKHKESLMCTKTYNYEGKKCKKFKRLSATQKSSRILKQTQRETETYPENNNDIKRVCD